jgi:hypothetical protein
MPIFRDSRLAERGQIDGAIRVVDGDLPGLNKRWVGPNGRWVFGVATLTPGRIGFSGYYGSVRFLARKPLEIAIESLGVPRPARVGELLRFGPFTRVVPLETKGATLEWEIHSLRVDWVVDRLFMAS